MRHLLLAALFALGSTPAFASIPISCTGAFDGTGCGYAVAYSPYSDTTIVSITCNGRQSSQRFQGDTSQGHCALFAGL